MNNETALTVPEQIERALAFTETKAQLVALAADSASITEITNTAGYQQCHAARIALKNARLTIEQVGKDARGDAIKFQKGIIAKEKELVAIIAPEEARLQELQDAVDNAKAREKAAKEEAERLASDAIRARFDSIKAYPLRAVDASTERLRELILEAGEADASGFGPVEHAAFVFERNITVAALKAALDRRIAADEEAVRISAEREELAKLRAEQQAVQAKREQLERAERDHIARIEAARIAEEREAIHIIEEAERQARQAKQCRIDAERAEQRKVEEKALRAEQEKIAEQKAALERQKKAQAKAAHDSEIANAGLHEAAREAVALLRTLGHADHIVTLKLAAAVQREPNKKAA